MEPKGGCIMAYNIHTSVYKARKNYRDDSADFIIEAMDWIRTGGELSFSELRAIAALKANNWQILKGQIYEKQFNSYEGQVYNFKTLPEIGKLCSRHGLYGED
jgi:threonine aldolase